MKSIFQKAAIFDMDGVLIVNMHFHELAFYEFGKRHNVEITRDFFLHHITGSTNERIMPRIFGNLSEQDIQEFSAEKESIYRELYAPEMKATDGLFEFLDYLQEKQVKMAIASNAPMENIRFVMEALRLDHYFKVVLNGTMVPSPKPAPDMFLLGAELLGAAPQNSVVFEDAIGGIKAANAAGMKAIGLITTHTAQELGKTDLVISDFQTSELYDFWERNMSL
jgi:HAD superfamily hydrolase (TIGR01509 family)